MAKTASVTGLDLVDQSVSILLRPRRRIGRSAPGYLLVLVMLQQANSKGSEKFQSEALRGEIVDDKALVRSMSALLFVNPPSAQHKRSAGTGRGRNGERIARCSPPSCKAQGLRGAASPTTAPCRHAHTILKEAQRFGSCIGQFFYPWQSIRRAVK